jgi:NTE family protein
LYKFELLCHAKKLGKATALLGLSALLIACTPFNYSGHDSPPAQLAISALDPPPRVALVLSSGGQRGYAHIGVMKVLEDAGIEFDLIVGTSVGSLLGAFWADGRNAKEIDALSREGGMTRWLDFSPFADRGWVQGQRLQEFVDGGLSHRTIEEMPRRLIVGATRRDDKVPVFFSSGRASVAVRASSAIKGLISPVGIDGIEYEDGDESLPLAVRAARQAGSRFVIAVDVSAPLHTIPDRITGAEREQMIERANRIAKEAAEADFLIHVGMKYYAPPFDSYFDYARTAGERSATDQLPQLTAALESAGLKRKRP